MGSKKHASKERCTAISRQTGEQCKNASVFGLKVCRFHGGGTKRSKAASARAKVHADMAAFVRPIDASDPENDPVAAFEIEFRRTIGRIRWYDEQIALLAPEALHWGETKAEDVRASEFAGVNVTAEARISILVAEQRVERTHLLAMEKVWIGAKLDGRRLEIQQSYVTMLDKALTGVLTALGHDASDPGVRQVVRDQLLALPVAGGA